MSRRPVVAVVTDAIFPGRCGGKELRYYEITQRLAAHADVHVYTMRWWGAQRAWTTGTVTLHGICPDISLYVGGRRSIWQAFVFAVACLRLVFHQFDVIEADHIPYAPLFMLKFVAAIKRKPLVATWHEVWGRRSWRTYLGALGEVAWWVEYLAMRLPDRIIAASQATKLRLEDHLGTCDHISVVPNGVDLDCITAAPPAATRTDVVVVSRLLAHKRIDLLLDALALLRAEGHMLTARVIGDGPEADALRQQVARAGMRSAVDFRSDVHEQTEVYSLLKAARVFVFPSEREGFGIAALEAIACGLPVVTTAAPDNLAQELVRRSEHGVVCAPSASALAEAIKYALVEGARSEAGCVDPWVRQYSWEGAAQEVQRVLFGQHSTSSRHRDGSWRQPERAR